ncbi:MAG: hypothetical protein WCA15_05665 [Candidatus Acidiferrales bacterium]
MEKSRKSILGWGLVGLGVTAVFVVYQLIMDTYPPRGPMAVDIVFMLLCPPSVLSVPVIDAEIGTSGFYFLFSIIGLINAALYGGIAAAIV